MAFHLLLAKPFFEGKHFFYHHLNPLWIIALTSRHNMKFRKTVSDLIKRFHLFESHDEFSDHAKGRLVMFVKDLTFS